MFFSRLTANLTRINRLDKCASSEEAFALRATSCEEEQGWRRQQHRDVGDK
jgi:hypothetical protein